METLGPKSTTNDYNDCTLVDVSANQVRWKVWNATVIARLMAENPHGGPSVWGPEITLNPEDNGADQCQGISVKSAAPGSPAVVQLITISPGDPVPASGVQLAGSLSPSGNFSPPVSGSASARIRRNPTGAGNQSIPTGALTVISFDLTDYDTNGIVSLPNRLVCQTAGVYSLKATVFFGASAAGTQRDVFIRLNGVTFIAADQRGPSPGTGTPEQTATTDYQLAIGDYVEAIVFQDSGGALDVNAIAAYSPVFSMSKQP